MELLKKGYNWLHHNPLYVTFDAICMPAMIILLCMDPSGFAGHIMSSYTGLFNAVTGTAATTTAAVHAGHTAVTAAAAAGSAAGTAAGAGALHAGHLAAGSAAGAGVSGATAGITSAFQSAAWFAALDPTLQSQFTPWLMGLDPALQSQFETWFTTINPTLQSQFAPISQSAPELLNHFNSIADKASFFNNELPIYDNNVFEALQNFCHKN